MNKRKKQRRQFRHLNQSDRDRIEALLRSRHKQEEIAKILDFDAATISREINRRKRKNGIYEATTAQHKANIKRSRSKYRGMKIEKYPQLKQYIISELKNHRSPDEIAGRLKEMRINPRIGANAIYKWLYSCWGQLWCKYLCTKRYRRRKQQKKTKRQMIPNRIPIEQRPKQGEHGEGDIFVSPIKTGTQRSGAIVCVPSSKLLIGTMIENKKPATMEQAIQKIIPKTFIDDLTLDNGIENRSHEQFGIDTYFTDPYSPWQKPHVENSIGLLRRWFIPKKTDLRNIPEEQLQEYLHILNNKYRKSLGYRSAYEVSLSMLLYKKHPLLTGLTH
jgi:IS30 family transposase